MVVWVFKSRRCDFVFKPNLGCEQKILISTACFTICIFASSHHISPVETEIDNDLQGQGLFKLRIHHLPSPGIYSSLLFDSRSQISSPNNCNSFSNLLLFSFVLLILIYLQFLWNYYYRTLRSDRRSSNAMLI